MSILNRGAKLGAHLSSDYSVDQFVNGLNIDFLPAKAVEAIAESGCPSNGLQPHESILNALMYLVAELEENHMHTSDEWTRSKVFNHVKAIAESE